MKLNIYKSRDGWRWRLLAHNGRIVADSAEAYTRSYDAKKSFLKIEMAIKLEGVEFTQSKEHRYP